MRRAAKTDRNHAEIVAELRSVGVHVTSLAAVGKGVPDILASYRGAWHVIEVKAPGTEKKHRETLARQSAFRAASHAKVHVVTSPHEALVAIGAVTPAGDRWALDNIS